MASYGNYSETCPHTFTNASLQLQYPGNTDIPWEVVGTWGPTPKYNSEGFIVRVPEMNKILMVFQGSHYSIAICVLGLETEVSHCFMMTSRSVWIPGIPCVSFPLPRHRLQPYLHGPHRCSRSLGRGQGRNKRHGRHQSTPGGFNLERNWPRLAIIPLFLACDPALIGLSMQVSEA